ARTASTSRSSTPHSARRPVSPTAPPPAGNQRAPPQHQRYTAPLASALTAAASHWRIRRPACAPPRYRDPRGIASEWRKRAAAETCAAPTGCPAMGRGDRRQRPSDYVPLTFVFESDGIPRSEQRAYQYLL